MNERDLTNAIHLAQNDLNSIPKGVAKRLRKQVRQVVLRDLQRRAITGEPSPFKRAPQ